MVTPEYNHQYMMDLAREMAQEEARRAMARQRHDYFSSSATVWPAEVRILKRKAKEDRVVPPSVREHSADSGVDSGPDNGGLERERSTHGSYDHSDDLPFVGE